MAYPMTEAKGDNKMKTIILKSGTNKGHRRIWIEGKALTSTGFVQGVLLTKTIQDGALILTKTTDQKLKKHRIAGTTTRPILDLCGKWVTALMAGKARVQITISSTTITIKPIK